MRNRPIEAREITAFDYLHCLLMKWLSSMLRRPQLTDIDSPLASWATRANNIHCPICRHIINQYPISCSLNTY